MKKIAEHLLDIKAVTLSADKPYIWASGIKSPIYCDNRLIQSFPEVRKDIILKLQDLLMEKYPDVEYLMGTATAGIPHASIMAWNLDMPSGFVRGKAKDHGKTNQIEGMVFEGAKCVVVEDLISTGKSSIEVVNTLREAGFDVLGVIAIFTYNMEKAKNNFEAAGTKYFALSNYEELLKVAVDRDVIKAEDEARLIQWRNTPDDESWLDK